MATRPLLSSLRPLTRRPCLPPPRTLSTSPSRPTLSSSSPALPTATPTQRRTLFLLSCSLLTTGVLLGSAFTLIAPRPAVVNLIWPLATPPPLAPASPEAKELVERLERELQGLEVVKRLKAERVVDPNPESKHLPPAPSSFETSLTAPPNSTSPASTPTLPKYTLSRPYAATPPGPHSLTGFSLRGPSKFALPPLVFTTRDKRESVLIVHVGEGLCGHEGVVHGGLLATVCDEALGRTALLNLPTNIGVTATLSMSYRKPTFANQFLVVRTELERREGRKAWVRGWVENSEGEVLAEASALFVEPRFAAFLSNSSVKEALK